MRARRQHNVAVEDKRSAGRELLRVQRDAELAPPRRGRARRDAAQRKVSRPDGGCDDGISECAAVIGAEGEVVTLDGQEGAAFDRSRRRRDHRACQEAGERHVFEAVCVLLTIQRDGNVVKRRQRRRRRREARHVAKWNDARDDSRISAVATCAKSATAVDVALQVGPVDDDARAAKHRAR